MDYISKSKSVHRHFHYHYHYDLKDQYMTEPTERYSSPSSFVQQNSHLSPNKTSWKDHINPQVTKLYEEISLHESFEDTYTPKASRLSKIQTRQCPHTANQILQKRSPQPREHLLQDIQIYEQYLKKHSQPNLYVPNTPTLRKNNTKNTPESTIRKRFVSLNELFQNRQNQQKNLQNIIFRKTNSKMMQTKREASTMQDTENQHQSQINISTKKIANDQLKYVRQSQIKSPSKNNIYQKARIRMSHIQDPTYRQKNEQLQNSNFSLFQRQGKKLSSGKNSDVFESDQKGVSQIKVEGQRLQKNRKNAQIYDYRFELMREQCEYLRDKFIKHVQKEHGLKF